MCSYNIQPYTKNYRISAGVSEMGGGIGVELSAGLYQVELSVHLSTLLIPLLFSGAVSGREEEGVICELACIQR